MSTPDTPSVVAGYDVAETATGSLYISVDAASADEAIEDIRAELGPAWSVEFAGTGNTDADGESTEDILISYNDDYEPDTDDGRDMTPPYEP